MSQPADTLPPAPSSPTAPLHKAAPRSRSLAEKLRLVGIVLLFILATAWLSQWLAEPRYQGQTLETWRTRLRDPDRLQRVFAVEALAFLAAQAATTPVDLRECLLEDADEGVRAAALATLTAIFLQTTGDGEEVTSFRRRAMLDDLLTIGREDPDPDRRVRAILALPSLCGLTADDSSPLAQEYRTRVLTLVIERLDAGTNADRRAMLALMETISLLPTEAELPLLAAYTRETGKEREQAVRCLIAIPTLSARSLDALMGQLTTPLGPRALPHLKRLKAEALPELILALKPSDPRASMAREALRQIGPTALRALNQVWQGTDLPMRRVAAQALASFGTEGMELLLPGLCSPDEATAALAWDAFLGAGPSAREFLLQQRPPNDPALAAEIAEILKHLPDPSTQKPT